MVCCQIDSHHGYFQLFRNGWNFVVLKALYHKLTFDTYYYYYWHGLEDM